MYSVRFSTDLRLTSFWQSKAVGFNQQVYQLLLKFSTIYNLSIQPTLTKRKRDPVIILEQIVLSTWCLAWTKYFSCI